MHRLVDEESRLEKEEVERQARGGFSGAQVARGNLSSTPFPEVMAQLYRWRSTGALLLRRDKIKKIVYVRGGYPVVVKSNLLSECLGRVMVRERMISEADCERSIQQMKETGRQQGTILIEMASISPHNLRYALQLQLEAKLYEVFQWVEGDYQFNPKGENPSATTELDQTPANLILEGVKRTWELPRLKDQLARHLDRFIGVHPDPLQQLQDLQLGGREEGFVQLIDGTRTLRELLAASPLEEQPAHALCYGLIAAQVVEARSRRNSAPDVTLAARAVPPPLKKAEDRPRPVDTPPPLPRPEARRPDSTPPTPAEREVRTPTPEDRERVEVLAARVKEMRKMNYFEMLGIARNASMEEVKKAYFSQAKDYHPDKLIGSRSAEVKALSDQIYSMLSTAYEVLSDARERDDYTRGLHTGQKTGVSDEVSRILAAESRFQKGEGFMRRRDWARACECFQEAVDLYADEGEFHSHLGWSLFNLDPQSAENSRRAEKHMEEGLRLNPRFDRGYLFLGWLYKATGRKDLAEKQFEKAIQCNPDCTEALRELKLMGASRGAAAGRR